MKCNFTYAHYGYILKNAKESYEFITYNNIASLNDSKKIILLRHDIDMDIFNALDMARIENELGIKSTYFIFLRSPFYNIFDADVKKIINEIIDRDHEIGLHFDETSYENLSFNSFEKTIKNEAEVLNKEFGVDVKVVSFHRPSDSTKENKIKLKNFKSTYDPIFFKQIKYLSDSRQFWKFGCPCRLIAEGERKLQILVHPVWWGIEDMPREKRLNAFVNKIKDKSFSGFTNHTDFIKTEKDIRKIREA